MQLRVPESGELSEVIKLGRIVWPDRPAETGVAAAQPVPDQLMSAAL
jgi:hypothetical protein